jgi:hypothetical protein
MIVTTDGTASVTEQLKIVDPLTNAQGHGGHATPRAGVSQGR